MTLRALYRKPIERPSVLILKDKHCTRVFRAGSEEELYASALKILKERSTGDYAYITDPREDGSYGKEPEVSREQIAALPKGGLRTAGEEQWKQYDLEQGYYKKECESWDLAQKALAEKDGKAAFAVLRRRRDYEYEGFDITELE